MIPNVCAKKANCMILLGPMVWYVNPPIIMAIGNPKNHIELISPNCIAVRSNASPNSGRTPARKLKENAVVMSAKQLP